MEQSTKQRQEILLGAIRAARGQAVVNQYLHGNRLMTCTHKTGFAGGFSECSACGLGARAARRARWLKP